MLWSDYVFCRLVRRSFGHLNICVFQAFCNQMCLNILMRVSQKQHAHVTLKPDLYLLVDPESLCHSPRLSLTCTSLAMWLYIAVVIGPFEASLNPAAETWMVIASLWVMSIGTLCVHKCEINGCRWQTKSNPNLPASIWKWPDKHRKLTLLPPHLSDVFSPSHLSVMPVNVTVVPGLLLRLQHDPLVFLVSIVWGAQRNSTQRHRDPTASQHFGGVIAEWRRHTCINAQSGSGCSVGSAQIQHRSMNKGGSGVVVLQRHKKRRGRTSRQMKQRSKPWPDQVIFVPPSNQLLTTAVKTDDWENRVEYTSGPQLQPGHIVLTWSSWNDWLC